MHGVLSTGYGVCMLFGALSSIASIHGSSNQGVDVGVAPLTITSNNLLAEFLPPICAIMICTGLEGRMIPVAYTTMVPLKWKMRLPLVILGSSCP